MTRIGVWIDHKTAVLVALSPDRVTTTTLDSGVDAHPRYSGGRERGGEKRYEQRHDRQLDHYYDDVIARLGTPGAVLLFGPGEAKLELQARLGRSKALADCAIAVEAADALTEPQMVAAVKAHFAATP